MKRLLLTLILLPTLAFAQQKKYDPVYHLDIHGCYEYAITALVHGDADLESIAGKKKKKAIYFSKEYYTAGFPEEIDGCAIKFIDIDLNKETLYKEQKSKKGVVMYMSVLNLTADTCDLWMIPIDIEKKGEEYSWSYNDGGCHVFYNFNKEAGKLGYLKTECKEAKKED